jgi:outer membrane protein assembly factor BamB
VAVGWLEQGRLAQLRAVCRFARGRLAGEASAVAEFDRLLAAAAAVDARRNWPMESRDAARTGFVADAGWGPPLRRLPAPAPRSFHDPAGLSGGAWGEGGFFYGLPFRVLPDPWVVTSGICLQDNVLYAGLKNGQMLALALPDGRLRWRFPGEGACVGAPLLYRGRLYYGGLDRRLYALDAERGRMHWAFPVHGWIEGGPAAFGDSVFVGSSDGRVWALDAALGVERWHADVGARLTGTPAVADGRVFIGAHDGTFTALDADTGAVLWRYAAGAAVAGGACVGHGRVCFGDAAGRVHALDVQSGTLAWREPCAVGGSVVAAPILVDRVLYGGTDEGRTVYGIDLDTGALAWSDTACAGTRRPALFAQGELWVVSRQEIARYAMTGPRVAEKPAPPGQGAEPGATAGAAGE